MTGSDCYALRCAILHNGIDEIESQRARDTIRRFVFLAGEGAPHCNLMYDILQLDLGLFCKEVCDACDNWRTTFLKEQQEAAQREASLMIYEGAGGVMFKFNPTTKRQELDATSMKAI
jgi:hypothetical protein